MYEAILSKLGLNKTEALAYESMIELGKATPAKFAAHSKISRVNAYQVLPKLEELGLLEKVTATKALEYAVTSPNKLMDILKQKEIETVESINKLKKIILKLEPIIRLTHNRPIIKYSQGTGEVKEAYFEILNSTKNKQCYGFLHRSRDPEFIEWLDNVVKPHRVKKNIHLSLITTDKESSTRLMQNNKAEKRDTKLIPSLSFPEGTYILFNAGRIMLMTKQSDEEETIGITIEHSYLAKSMKAMFDLLWEE